MVRWDDLSPAEITVLETVFWSSGISRSELAEQSGFSRSKAKSIKGAWLEFQLQTTRAVHLPYGRVEIEPDHFCPKQTGTRF